jgi:hypothetical protein
VRVECPSPIKTVIDYEFVYDQGMSFSMTLDTEAGDTIEFTPLTIEIKLVAKPSLNDPTKTLPAEDISIYLSKVASIRKVSRQMILLTDEEKLNWQRDFKSMTIQ